MGGPPVGNGGNGGNPSGFDSGLDSTWRVDSGEGVGSSAVGATVASNGFTSSCTGFSLGSVTGGVGRGELGTGGVGRGELGTLWMGGLLVALGGLSTARLEGGGLEGGLEGWLVLGCSEMNMACFGGEALTVPVDGERSNPSPSLRFFVGEVESSMSERARLPGVVCEVSKSNASSSNALAERSHICKSGQASKIWRTWAVSRAQFRR